MGSVPDWYGIIRASRYLGVPPWELAKQPSFWMNAALTAEAAEIEGENAQR